jgi:hypothetical protein
MGWGASGCDWTKSEQVQQSAHSMYMRRLNKRSPELPQDGGTNRNAAQTGVNGLARGQKTISTHGL